VTSLPTHRTLHTHYSHPLPPSKGFALSWDEIIYDGNPEEQKFAAFFIKDDKVLAVASLNHDPTVSQSAELMYQGKMPSGTQLRENTDLKAHL